MSEVILRALREQTFTCAVCKDLFIGKEVNRHHTTPVTKGGSKGETETVCYTCHGHIHAQFTEKELADMSFAKLLETIEMQDYIEWREKHPGIYGHRMSNKVKKWKKGHR
jgi:5-methylcytosine-specific restriction endonuclease McrA